MIKNDPFFPLINHTVIGEGPGVVLLHGLASSRSDWIWLAPALCAAGFRVYMPDLMGHGDSVKPNDSTFYTILNTYTLLEDWLDNLQDDGTLSIVGHSLGGYLAMKLAHRRPSKVASLVLIDPYFSQNQLHRGLRLLNRRPDISARALRYAPPWLVNGLIGLDPWTTNSFPPEVRQQIALDYLRASPHIMHIPGSVSDLTTIASELHQPALVIWGEKDFTLSANSFLPLVRQLQKSTGKSVPNCGHQPHLSRPELINPWIIDHLKLLKDHNHPKSD